MPKWHYQRQESAIDLRMVSTSSALRYFPYLLIYPLRDNAALVIGVLAFLLWVGTRGLQGIPAFMIAMIWTIHYALLVIERSAEGHATPPTLGADALFLGHGPWIKALLFPTAVISGAYSLNAAGFRTTASALLGITAFVLPAHWLILASERELLRALNPLRLGRVIGVIGAIYIIVCAALILAVEITLWLADRWNGALFVALVLYLLFLICHLLGFAAYHRHEALGLAVRISSPSQAEQQLERQSQQLALLLSGVDQKIRQREWQSALEMVQTDVENLHDPRVFHEELFEKLQSLDSVALVLSQGQRLISLLLAKKQLDRALDIHSDCQDFEQDFTLNEPGDFMRLAQYALSIKQIARFERMLVRADHYYPSIAVPLILLEVQHAVDSRDDEAARAKLLPLLVQREHALYPQILSYARILDVPTLG